MGRWCVMNRVWAWYRRHYLLVNVSILFLLIDLALGIVDPLHRVKTPLDDALAEIDKRPAGTRSAVLLVGNSAVQVGVDAKDMETQLERAGLSVAVYNVGLASTSLRDIPHEIAAVEKRGVKVAAVVVGMNLFAGDVRFEPLMYPWADRSSPYVFFYRTLWRRRIARNVVKAWHRVTKTPEKTDDAGSQDFRETVFLARFQNTTPSDLAFSELGGILKSLASNGIATHVVLLPQNPKGTAQLAQYAELMRALRAEMPKDLLDVADSFSPDEFRDVGHLNEHGRAHLTDALARWLTLRMQAK
jgi:hypothetical protein